MATSKSYVAVETSIKFNGEAGADVALSAEGVTDGAGRVSAQYDLGATPRAEDFRWNCEVLFQATPTQGEVLEIYAAGAPDNDSTMIDGDPGATDAALGDVDQVRNMKRLGSVVVEDAATTKMVGHGTFRWTQRYISIVIKNESGATINATDSNFLFFLTPIPPQGQAT